MFYDEHFLYKELLRLNLPFYFSHLYLILIAFDFIITFFCGKINSGEIEKQSSQRPERMFVETGVPRKGTAIELLRKRLT